MVHCRSGRKARRKASTQVWECMSEWLVVGVVVEQE